MSATYKLTDQDKTSEFELPENFHKKAEELKEKQKIIDQELNKAKSEKVVRQFDETTRVFQFREEQASAKLKELEIRKDTIEKELHQLLQQKNNKLHDHLRKVTEVLVSETRKIVPLEKDFESGISKIQNLKNEMQQLFEQNIEDRKKNTSIIDEQNKEIKALGLTLKETTVLIQNDFHKLTNECEILLQQKNALLNELSTIKDKVTSQTAVLSVLEEKENRLKRYEESNAQLTDKSVELSELQFKINHFNEELNSLKNEKLKMDREVLQIDLMKSESHAVVTRLEFSIKDLEGQVEGKRNEIQNLEKAYLEAKIRLENIRNEEFDLLKSVKSQQSELSQVNLEIAKLEGVKTAALKMQEDALAFLEEKKEFYQREQTILEENLNHKISRLDAEFNQKKTEWEHEFKSFMISKEKDLEVHLAELEQLDLEEMKRKQNELVTDIIESFKKISNRESFTTQEQKADELKNEIKTLFERHLGNIGRWNLW